MARDLISLSLPQAKLTAIDSALSALETALAELVALEADARKRLPIAPRSDASKERAAKLFESVATDPANKRADLPIDQNKVNAGVEVHTQQLNRGQVWVESREGKIIDAGVNRAGAER